MSKLAIKVDDLSKQYRLGTVGTGTISHDLNRWWHKVRGKEDPYLKLTETNSSDEKSKSDYVWALKNINFEVKQGEVVGVIGRNGAGKSTLLKILSQVTAPTKGCFKARGRIASLLEVGTGFHNELTGRENIYLNGAILGMTKKEITSKIEEIIEFSGVENYIDTPVKRYSSGMKVRLAFAVAAHLEPDILIVDEVLAVGDAAFQKKAIGKMKDISKGEGRTVLFVSHNMTSISHLCDRGLVLSNGTNVFNGEITEAVAYYLETSTTAALSSNTSERKGTGFIRVEEIDVFSKDIDQIKKPTTGKDLFIKFSLNHEEKISGEHLKFDFRIDNYLGAKVFWISTRLVDSKIADGTREITFVIPRCPLNSGKYYGTFQCTYKGEVTDWLQNAFEFDVMEGLYYKSGKAVPTQQSDMLVDFYLM